MMGMHAKNGSVPMDGAVMHYVSFGSGKTGILLPGFG